MAADTKATDVKERVGQAATSSREEASDVADTVKEEAKGVTHEARVQAESVAHQMIDDVRRQVEGQASGLAKTLHHAGDELRAMAEAGEQQSIATTVIRESGDAAHRLAGRLDDGGVSGSLADVRAFARRSPGTFLFGALAAGFATGRLVRNLSAASSQSANPGTATPTSAVRPALDVDDAEHVATGPGGGSR